MSYDGRVMRRALARYNEDKQRRGEEFAARRETVYAQIPRLREIGQELSTTMSRLIGSALRQGTDPLPAIRVLRDENLELQRQRAELLVENGYPMDYLDEKPLCAKCGDTGYCDGQACECLQKYYRRAQIGELSRMLDLRGQSFETFSFDWYSTERAGRSRSPRENIERNYDMCADFARHFPSGRNLLLTGDPGLGKTFLSACIARVVSDGGYSVVYDTAGHIFAQLENKYFHREGDGVEEDTERYRCCDLLILDDLGTEMVNSFIQSALYQMINGRLLDGKKTVISTNLNPRQMGERYSPQILSRLEGEYSILPFFGEDIRLLKRQREEK